MALLQNQTLSAGYSLEMDRSLEAQHSKALQCFVLAADWLHISLYVKVIRTMKCVTAASSYFDKPAP